MEPAQDSYDWTFLDQLIGKARSKNLKLHLVFNGFNFVCRANYVPGYIKNDKTTYQRIIDPNGNEIPWANSIQVCANDPDTLAREKKLFEAFMAHLKDVDSQDQTVPQPWGKGYAIRVSGAINLIYPEG
jgi:hypothetical protein